MLEAATSPNLKPAFDQQFVKSVSELMDRFRELESVELWVLKDRQQDVTGAIHKLEELQQRMSDAQARYDQAKELAEGTCSTAQRPLN